MPNVGQHFKDLAVCPRCENPRIRIRRRVHAYMPWRCRRCNRVFRTPKVQEFVFSSGEYARGYIDAAAIPRLESRSRRRRNYLRKRKAKKALVGMVVMAGIGFIIWWILQDEYRTLDSTPAITSILAPSHTPTPTHPPHLRHLDEKQYMLELINDCLLYTSPSPRDRQKSRMPSSA